MSDSHLILKALRAFYLVAAYGEFGDLDDLEQLETFVCQLRETYGKDYNDVHDLSLNINLSIDGSSSSSFSRTSSDDDDLDDVE